MTSTCSGDLRYFSLFANTRQDNVHYHNYISPLYNAVLRADLKIGSPEGRILIHLFSKYLLTTYYIPDTGQNTKIERHHCVTFSLFIVCHLRDTHKMRPWRAIPRNWDFILGGSRPRGVLRGGLTWSELSCWKATQENGHYVKKGGKPVRRPPGNSSKTSASLVTAEVEVDKFSVRVLVSNILDFEQFYHLHPWTNSYNFLSLSLLT